MDRIGAELSESSAALCLGAELSLGYLSGLVDPPQLIQSLIDNWPEIAPYPLILVGS